MSTALGLSGFPPGYLEENKSYEVVGTAIAFIVINTVATGLRVCARHIQKEKTMAADYFMPISLIFNIGVCICLLLGAKWGVGRHIEAVPAGDLVKFTYLTYYGMSSAYVFAVTFSKLAILDLYLHIFIDKPSRYTTYVLQFVIVGSLIGNFIGILAQCIPFAHPTIDDPTPGGHCGNLHAHFTWASLPNIVTDFAMMILPIPLILRIHQPWQVKLGIWISFLVGSLGIITAIIRLNIFYKYGWNTNTANPTWVSAIIFIWTCVEPGVYHLAACTLTLRPLFAWIIFDSSVSSILLRSRILSGRSRRGTYGSTGPHDTPKRTINSQPSIDPEHRNDLLYPDKGHSISLVTTENERHSLDDLGSNINVQREVMVSEV